MEKLFTCIDCRHCNVNECEYSIWFDNVVRFQCTCEKSNNAEVENDGEQWTPWFDVDDPHNAMCEYFEKE